MKLRKLFLLVTLVVVSHASAIIVDNGDYTTDTTSGLDWLDISFTLGESYNTTLLRQSGDLSGWRFATRLEFDVFVNNVFGFVYSNRGVFDPSVFTESKRFISLTGASFGDLSTFNDDFDLVFVTGNVDSSAYSETRVMQVMAVGANHYLHNLGTPTGYVRAFSEQDAWAKSKDGIHDNNGSFLVRSSSYEKVPDTGSTLALLGIGILGLVVARRHIRS